MKNQRFDDIIDKVRSGDDKDFAKLVDDYNKRTTKWEFWDYVEETVKLGGLTYKDAFKLARIYIDQTAPVFD